MAYSSVNNLQVIDAIGASPLIPFKSNATSGIEKDGTERNGAMGKDVPLLPIQTR